MKLIKEMDMKTIKGNEACKQFVRALEAELNAVHDVFSNIDVWDSVIDSKELEHALNALRRAVRDEAEELLDIMYKDK